MKIYVVLFVNWNNIDNCHYQYYYCGIEKCFDNYESAQKYVYNKNFNSFKYLISNTIFYKQHKINYAKILCLDGEEIFFDNNFAISIKDFDKLFGDILYSIFSIKISESNIDYVFNLFVDLFINRLDVSSDNYILGLDNKQIEFLFNLSDYQIVSLDESKLESIFE